MKADFWKTSTAGNTTLFLDRRCDAKAALGIIPAEQAAHVDFPGRRLDMAGGEFCVNACLAYGALLDALGFLPERILAGGIDVGLQVQGKMPVWQVRAVFPIPEHSWEETQEARICHLGGISHALMPCCELPPIDESFAKAKARRKEFNLDARVAAGVVWWREHDGKYELQPVVSVPALGTCNLEQACGSASIALALAHGAGKYAISQPSGKILLVEMRPDSLEVNAEVMFLASGHLWSADVSI